MVLTLAIPVRKLFGLEDFITMRHLDNMGKVLLATGLIVGYGYMMEAFSAYYSGNQYERFMILNRMGGPYAVVYWCLVACNIVTPQFLWSRKVRSKVGALFAIAMVVNLGMWLERFVIVVTSLHRDLCPRLGECITRRAGIFIHFSAPSDFSWRCCSCSSGSCR